MSSILPSEHLILKRPSNIRTVDVQRCEFETFIQLMGLVRPENIYICKLRFGHLRRHFPFWE